MQEMTPRAKDSLVSFGERLSTRVFAAYLRRLGIPARQHDAWDLGLVTSDEFTNAEIDYDRSLSAVRAGLQGACEGAAQIAVLTGFVGRGRNTGAALPAAAGAKPPAAVTLSLRYCACLTNAPRASA